MSYPLLKTIHIVGAIVFIGNLVVTAFWKAFADRTGDLRVMCFAQRLVAYTDVAFTGGGAAVVGVTGLLLARPYFEYLLQLPWLLWGLVLFGVSGALWGFVLIPIQMRQARLLESTEDFASVREPYRRLATGWNVVGVIATVLPLVNVWLMTSKPEG